jgi:hypothetical protein
MEDAVHLAVSRKNKPLVEKRMYSGLVHAHSGLRWIALLLLVAAVATAISRWQSRAGFTESNRKLYLFALIAVHTQLVIGLILYFISPKVNTSLISDKVYRFYTIEHLVGMLVAIALVTVGYSRAKRLSAATSKHKTVALFMGLGLVLILVMIPWPFRGLGAGWF